MKKSVKELSKEELETVVTKIITILYNDGSNNFPVYGCLEIQDVLFNANLIDEDE